MIDFTQQLLAAYAEACNKGSTVMEEFKMAAFSMSNINKSNNLLLQIATICNQYDALTVSFIVCLFFIFYSFTWSIIGQNCSKVDQIWSITPVVYGWLL